MSFVYPECGDILQCLVLWQSGFLIAAEKIKETGDSAIKILSVMEKHFRTENDDLDVKLMINRTTAINKQDGDWGD